MHGLHWIRLLQTNLDRLLPTRCRCVPMLASNRSLERAGRVIQPGVAPLCVVRQAAQQQRSGCGRAAEFER